MGDEMASLGFLNGMGNSSNGRNVGNQLGGNYLSHNEKLMLAH